MYIAGLFHDIAKGRGGDHSKLGMVEVARFARQHGLSKAQTDLVVFLVGEHLEMSQFAQKEDLSDPDVILRFVEKVKTPERLQALYLLTVADIRGTSPKVWNAWKDKLLAGLYRAAMHVLEGNSQQPRATVIKERQERVRELLVQQIERPEILERAEQLWRDLTPEYFLRHDTMTIAWHAYHIIQADEHEEILVAGQHYVLNDDDNCVQLMVYTHDQPDLFARICAAIMQRGYSIFSAHIYTSAQNRALDTFQIIVPDSVQVDQQFLNQFAHAVRDSVQNHTHLRKPSLGRLSARSRNFPIKPSMSLMPTGNDDYVLKLTATDRPGVLYSVAYHFHEMGVKLHNARITTLGERLEDVFVVHSPQLASPSFAAELEHRLMTVCTI
jgi:[protein-PII] uridylyltransferase